MKVPAGRGTPARCCVLLRWEAVAQTPGDVVRSDVVRSFLRVGSKNAHLIHREQVAPLVLPRVESGRALSALVEHLFGIGFVRQPRRKRKRRSSGVSSGFE